MFTSLFLSTLLAAIVAVVHADPVPSEPGPGSTYNQGASCPIAWDVDPTGIWTVMNIELMSGSNTDMNHITTVATLDGTDPKNTTFSWPCPAVTPNAPIYFYQFTSPFSTDYTWTTRFTIANQNGNSVAAANPTQPNGQAIPWGIGQLQDPSLATPAPAVGTNVTASSSTNGTSTASGTSSPSTVASIVSSPATTPVSSGFATILPSSTNSNLGTSPSAAPTGSGSSSTSGNTTNSGISVGSSTMHLALTVVAASAAFVFVL